MNFYQLSSTSWHLMSNPFTQIDVWLFVVYHSNSLSAKPWTCLSIWVSFTVACPIRYEFEPGAILICKANWQDNFWVGLFGFFNTTVDAYFLLGVHSQLMEWETLLLQKRVVGIFIIKHTNLGQLQKIHHPLHIHCSEYDRFANVLHVASHLNLVFQMVLTVLEGF